MVEMAVTRVASGTSPGPGGWAVIVEDFPVPELFPVLARKIFRNRKIFR